MKALVPITIDQIRAALDEDDFAWHEVTRSDAGLMGLSNSIDSAEPRLFAWMREKGWRLAGEAAGNYHFKRGTSEHIWLEENTDVAAAQIVNALRGEGELLPQHGVVTERDDRPGYDILADIAATEPAPADVEASENATGGGMMIFQAGKMTYTDSWSE